MPDTFFVAESGTIDEGDESAPQSRAEVYYDIDVRYIQSPDELLEVVESCYELRQFFETLVSSKIEEIEEALADEDAEHTRAEWRRIEGVQAALSSGEDPLEVWIKSLGDDGLDQAVEEIARWLRETPDWDYLEWWPQGTTGQSRVYTFFEEMDAAQRTALGVRLVDGDRPLSNYVAAELYLPIEDANRAAENLGLQIRFERRKPAEPRSTPITLAEPRVSTTIPAKKPPRTRLTRDEVEEWVKRNQEEVIMRKHGVSREDAAKMIEEWRKKGDP